MGSQMFNWACALSIIALKVYYPVIKGNIWWQIKKKYLRSYQHKPKPVLFLIKIIARLVNLHSLHRAIKDLSFSPMI